MESRRRSTRPPVPPSTESGGSLPRFIVSASNLRFAPRSLAWSKTTVPLHSRSRRTNLRAVACDLDGTQTPIGPVKVDRTAKVKLSLDSGAPPHAHPQRDTAKNG